MKKEQLISRLKSDFGFDFDMKSLRAIGNPGRNTMIRIKTRYYMRLNAFAKIKIREFDDPEAARRGVRIAQYRDALFHSSVVLRFDPPCFDSGDRQYDSRRTLYLVHGLTDVSAVYCVEGYEVSELYVLDEITAASEKLIRYLRKAKFPAGHLKIL